MGPRYGHHGGYLPREYTYVPPATSPTQEVLEELGVPVKKLSRYMDRRHYAAAIATAAGYAWKHRKQAAWAYNTVQAMRARRAARQRAADAAEQRLNALGARGTPVHRGRVQRAINFNTNSGPRAPRRPRTTPWRHHHGEL